MTRFEYKTIDIPTTKKNAFSMTKIDKEKLKETLKGLGEQGWELITTLENTYSGSMMENILVFKRAVS